MIDEKNNETNESEIISAESVADLKVAKSIPANTVKKFVSENTKKKTAGTKKAGSKKNISKKDKKLPPLIEVLIVICNSGKGESVIKMLNFLNVNLQVLSRGEGTADSKMKEILGFSEGDKDIISCLIRAKDRAYIFDSLKKTLFVKEKQIGIAFTVPIDSALSGVLDRIGFVFLEGKVE